MDVIEIYDIEGKHIGYGILNSFGGYDLYNDKNVCFGEAIKLEKENTEVLDKYENSIGYLHDYFLGGNILVYK